MASFGRFVRLIDHAVGLNGAALIVQSAQSYTPMSMSVLMVFVGGITMIAAAIDLERGRKRR